MLYKDFAPTGFDRSGAFLPERQDWIVCPCCQTRDSEALERSNFQIALEMLGGESNSVEIHRFSHWGPGWLEIIIVKPGSKQANILGEIQESLEYYPILDETHFSKLEWEENSEFWDNACTIEFRIDMLKGINCNIFSARKNWADLDCKTREELGG